MPATILKRSGVLGKLAKLISAVTRATNGESDFTACLGLTVENWVNSH